MRWLFPDPADAQENRERQKVIGKIDAWWSEFQKRTGDLDAVFNGKNRKWDLPSWMHQHLGAVSEHLMWEFGPGENGHRLAITPEGRKYLRPLADQVLARAPRIPGWTFMPGRPAEDVESMAATVEARTESEFDCSAVSVAIGEGNTIDLAFHVPNMDDEDHALGQCFIATESLLGEAILDKWIGLIEPTAKRPKGHWAPLERLHETVVAGIESIRDQMPGEPIWRREIADDYSGLELEPDEADDYPGRTDLIAAMTCWLEPWQIYHSGRNFYSDRFSKTGEKFCYLKMDHSDWPRESLVDSRTRVEDALVEVLRANDLGTSTGGGSGLMYAYIDLVLGNVEKAIPVIRDICRKQGVHKRSWLLFWDSEWRDEWIGIHNDSPPPPAFPDED